MEQFFDKNECVFNNNYGDKKQQKIFLPLKNFEKKFWAHDLQNLRQDNFNFWQSLETKKGCYMKIKTILNFLKYN